MSCCKGNKWSTSDQHTQTIFEGWRSFLNGEKEERKILTEQSWGADDASKECGDYAVGRGLYKAVHAEQEETGMLRWSAKDSPARQSLTKFMQECMGKKGYTDARRTSSQVDNESWNKWAWEKARASQDSGPASHMPTVAQRRAGQNKHREKGYGHATSFTESMEENKEN